MVRLEGSCIVVSRRSPRGVPYVHRYALRNGVRHHAQLVQPATADALRTDDQRERLRRIDALYREWSRNRADVELLRRLQAAVGECLEEAQQPIG